MFGSAILFAWCIPYLCCCALLGLLQGALIAKHQEKLTWKQWWVMITTRPGQWRL